MPDKKTLLIILPCYNPQPGWHLLVKAKIEELQAASTAILIRTALVNDGSATALNEGVEFLKKRLEHFQYFDLLRNRGKGYSIRYVVKRTTHDYYVYTDIDFPYQINSMLAIIDQMAKEKSDAVIGIRDADYYQKIPKFRKFVSVILKTANSFLFHLITSDTQCGLKGFNHKNGREYFLQTRLNGYLFDLEFIRLISNAKGLKSSMVQVKLREGVQLSRMSIKSLALQSIDYLKLLLR